VYGVDIYDTAAASELRKAARSCSFRSAQVPNAQGSSAGILRRKVARLTSHMKKQ
jgi:hypothetical protein